MLIPLEIVESFLSLKILKLHNHVWEDIRDSLHELIHKLLCLLIRHTWLAETEIEWIAEVALVASSIVENDWKSVLWWDTGSSSVESKLANLSSLLVEASDEQFAGHAYWNANTIHSKIAESENSRAISYDADAWIWMWPVSEDSSYRLSLLDGDVKSFWLGVEGGILEADIANGWCVDEWHELLNVVDEDTIKEIRIRRLEIREIEVLVDVGAASIYHLHGASNLCLH